MTQDKDMRREGAAARDLPPSDDLEAIQQRFIEEWEAGKEPTLETYVERYPHFTEELMDFVLSFVQMEAALAQTPEVWTPSPETERARERALAGPCGPARSVAEVRKAMGWSVRRLAQATNLPAEMITWTERGRFTDYPARFETRLAGAVSWSPSLIATMLHRRDQLGEQQPQAPRRLQFHATGKPRDTSAPPCTFREGLLECERLGKLTPEMRREWLDEEAA